MASSCVCVCVRVCVWLCVVWSKCVNFCVSGCECGVKRVAEGDYEPCVFVQRSVWRAMPKSVYAMLAWGIFRNLHFGQGVALP